MICSLIKTDRKDLAKIAAVSPALAGVVRPLLYRNLSIRLNPETQVKATLDMLRRETQVASAVTSLEVSALRSFEKLGRTEEEERKDREGRTDLVKLLVRTLANMVSLQGVSISGDIFQDDGGQTSFFSCLSKLPRLKSLRMCYGKMMGTNPSDTGAFKLTCLVVDQFFSFPSELQ